MITSNLQMRKLRFRDIKILTMVTQLIHETEISSHLSLTSELMYAPSTGYHVLLSHQLLKLFTFIALFCNLCCKKKKMLWVKKNILMFTSVQISLVYIVRSWIAGSYGPARKESVCNAGDLGSIPGLGRSPGEGKDYSLQYSGLENSMDCSTPGFPVHHQLLELTQTYVHQVSDGIQPSHPLSSPSPPAFSLSQHQGFF